MYLKSLKLTNYRKFSAEQNEIEFISSKLIKVDKKTGNQNDKDIVENGSSNEEITEIDNKKYITGYNERYIRIAVPSDSGEDLKICNTIQEVCISGRIPGGILFGYIEQ